MKTQSRAAIIVLLLTNAAAHVDAIGGVDAPPPASAPRPFNFTQPKETKLENGLRVIVAERPELPLLAAELVVRNGAEIDPPNLAGTASMTGSLLTKGTESMSAPQIASAIESLGGQISSGAGWDSSTASIVVMSDYGDTALTILADVVQYPIFKQEEIDRLRKQRLDSLRVALQQPGSLADFVEDRVVFGSSEYGHSASGTLETLQAIQRDDIVKFYQSCYGPSNSALVLVGNVTLEQGKTSAQKFFGNWKSSAAGERKAAPGGSEWKTQDVVIDMPQAGQSAVMVSKPAIKRDSPDYYSGLVANAALGNGFVSRLNREIRIKRGLSYGVRSSLEARRDAGSFSASAQTKNESAAEVAKLIMNELARMATEPVAGEELKSRQAILTGSYARGLETDEGFAGNLASLATFNLPLDRLNAFIPKINAVTTQDVAAFVTKYLAPKPSLIVVGKTPAFLDPLKKDFPNLRVIGQSDLDLNRPELIKQK